MGYAAKMGNGPFEGGTGLVFDLKHLSDCQRPVADGGNPGPDWALAETRLSRLIDERRLRGEFFPRGLFSDPAWEILLAVALSEARQHRLDITSLCASVDVPPTTVLRWITTLMGDGFLRRLDDATDRRRKYVELTPPTSLKMLQYAAATDASETLAA